MIDKAELRSMSRAERHELAVLLAELDEPVGTIEPAHAGELAGTDAPVARASQHEPVRLNPFWIDPVLARERRLALLVSAACSIVLAGWIVLLAATLPHQFNAHHWRTVWVIFDVFLLAAFAATAWAIWRQRQVLILLLVLIGTMLCCDAWFDVATSLATSGFGISLLSAVLAELPLAFLAFAGARRLLRATVAAGILAGAMAGARQVAAPGAQAGPEALDWARAGHWGRTCAGQSLRRAPLAGAGLHEALPRSRAERRADRARRSGRGGRSGRSDQPA